MSAPLCPDCCLPLSEARFGPVRVLACRSCGGAWFPHGSLKAIAAAGDRVVRKLAEHLRAARNAVPPPPSVHPACPECSQPLLSNPSVTLTGVEVRACIPCKGHWASMRALQILASQLMPRPRCVDSAVTVEASSSAARRSEGLPSWKMTGPCPRCLGDRQIVECGEEAIEVCSDCGGAWIQKDSGESLRTRSQPARSRLLVEVKRIRSGRHRKPQRELLCPACGLAMTSSPSGAPACPKCASAFIDFYALPEFLALSHSARV